MHVVSYVFGRLWPWPGRVASFRSLSASSEAGGVALIGYVAPSAVVIRRRRRRVQILARGFFGWSVLVCWNRWCTHATCRVLLQVYSSCLQHGNRGTGRHVVEVIRRACTGALRAEDEQA